MNKFIVISFFTKDTPYEIEVEKLRESCKKFNIEHDIRGYESRGTWQLNTCIKPEFIYDMLIAYPDRCLCFIDADGIIQQYPKLFETITEDVGVHYKDDIELLSGTLFIRNNDNTKMMLRRWMAYLADRSGMADQKGLQYVLKNPIDDYPIKIHYLPPQYTQIFDLMNHHGRAVIEHFQASRRFKREMNLKHGPQFIPDHVQGLFVRKCEDGSFFLPRASRALIAQLNKTYQQVPGELRWHARDRGKKTLDELKPFFDNKDCYIVGKGPSLDHLTTLDFPDHSCPVIAINESIHKVETLCLPNKIYMIQQDAWLKDSCQPESADLLLAYPSRHWYAQNSNKYVFHYADIGLNKNSLTAVYAITIAKKCGCIGLHLLCFDACMNSNTDYAKCIGYDSIVGGKPDRFLTHKRAITGSIGDTTYEFISPKVHESSKLCKP